MGVPALKRFSQSFLVDRGVAERIVDQARIGAGEPVLEIGPGRGALTSALAERAGFLRLVEIDRALTWDLACRFAGTPHVEVLHGDVLKLGLERLLAGPDRFHVVSNLPYHVTTPLLVALLDQTERVRDATWMMQREVAARLAAAPDTPEYGSLSLLVQRTCEVTPLFDVAPGAFRPRPAVHSTVVRIVPLETPRIVVRDPLCLRAVVRAAFGQRRKTLRNALRGAGFSPEAVTAAATHADIDLARRGETLTLAEFGALADALASLAATTPRPEAGGPASSG